MRRALACLLGLVAIAGVRAGEWLTHPPYPEGYTEDNYVHHGGLFYKGDQAYTREKVTWVEQVPYVSYAPSYSYGSCGYGYSPGYSYTPSTYYKPQTYYKWRYVPVSYTPPVATVPAYAPGWQGKLLDIAAARDKVEGQLRTSALDQIAYLNALKALGLENNFKWPNYGATPAYPAAAPYVPSYGNAGYGTGTYAQQITYGSPVANTLYGVSYNSIKDLYGESNLNTLYSQAARLSQNAQTLAGQATTDFSDLVGKEGSNRARVAEILAKAQAATAALQAANPQAQAHTESRVFSFRTEQSATGEMQLVPINPQGQGGQGGGYGGGGGTGGQGGGGDGTTVPATPPGQAPVMPRADGAQFQALQEQKCGACHSGGQAKGGYNTGQYAGMSQAEKAKRVWPRLTHADPAKRMPLNKDGGPGVPLTADELYQFYTH